MSFIVYVFSLSLSVSIGVNFLWFKNFFPVMQRFEKRDLMRPVRNSVVSSEAVKSAGNAEKTAAKDRKRSTATVTKVS